MPLRWGELSAAAFAVSAMLAGSAGAHGSSGKIASNLSGHWEVEDVATDHASNLAEVVVYPQDPELVGRTLEISSARVTLESWDAFGCKKPKWRSHNVTWGSLFQNSFMRNTSGGRSPRPKPSEYGFDFPPQRRTKAYSFCEDKRAGSWFRGPWLAEVAKDQMLLRVSTDVALVLRRRPADAKPKASFECASAQTETQKVICGSFDLASWDRSVALAFRLVLENHPEKKEAMRQSQYQFLKQRESCAGDAECIDELQWKLVEELRYEAYHQ